jgi:hypothetical protein
MKLYVASSWRNVFQPSVVEILRSEGHEVYDFRNPPGRSGFAWAAIDRDWKKWSLGQYLKGLSHPLAREGFRADYQAMTGADAGVLVLPSGRSAHLEAGYFVGAGKPLYILLLTEQEPELMYKMATAIYTDITSLAEALAA